MELEVRDIRNYVTNIKENTEFKVSNINVEHRMNNSKRDFIFVNKSQCKHIPCSPSTMINMCKQLSELVYKYTMNEYYNILVIGFAETATAIAEFTADNLPNCHYIVNTTRETIHDGVELVRFEEEHSHATTQKLLTYKDNIIDLKQYDYILFIDDEISTGNTILNFIKEIDKLYKNMKYGVASICNWQNEENIEKFKELNIDVYSLIQGNLIDEHKKLLDTNLILQNSHKKLNALDIIFSPVDSISRLGHKTSRNITNRFKEVLSLIKRYGNEIYTIRIIGTEEYMYIPIRIGYMLEEKGYNVVCHSTTRSPIDIITTENNKDTINSRYRLKSVYDKERENYIYNLDITTDLTILITDLRSYILKNI